jgi:hypothetical protein
VTAVAEPMPWVWLSRSKRAFSQNNPYLSAVGALPPGGTSGKGSPLLEGGVGTSIFFEAFWKIPRAGVPRKLSGARVRSVLAHIWPLANLQLPLPDFEPLMKRFRWVWLAW